jgi:hypothetical protein
MKGQLRRAVLSRYSLGASKDTAQVAAERLFASDSVERYIKANLKGWIFVSNLAPDSLKR